MSIRKLFESQIFFASAFAFIATSISLGLLEEKSPPVPQIVYVEWGVHPEDFRGRSLIAHCDATNITRKQWAVNIILLFYYITILM